MTKRLCDGDAGSHRKTVIHVNTQRIRQNQKKARKQPVITVKNRNTNQYGHEVEIPGGCRVVYRPDSPMCGARVWIESLYDVKVIDLNIADLKLASEGDIVRSF